MARSKVQGFTLLEIMVVVVILAILTSIAVSSFSGSTRDSQRARAMAGLSALNDAAARYYQTAFTYQDMTIAGLTAAATLALPTEYTFTVVPGADNQSYQVRAVPVAGGTMAGDGGMMMSSIGQRCYYPGNDAPNYTTCPKSF